MPLLHHIALPYNLLLPHLRDFILIQNHSFVFIFCLIAARFSHLLNLFGHFFCCCSNVIVHQFPHSYCSTTVSLHVLCNLFHLFIGCWLLCFHPSMHVVSMIGLMFPMSSIFALVASFCSKDFSNGLLCHSQMFSFSDNVFKVHMTTWR